MNALRIACGLLALAGMPSAQAFIDPLVLVPAQPVEGQDLSFTIRHGGCDSISVPAGGGANNLFRQVDIVGSAVRITVVYGSTLPPFCNYPVFTSQIWFGALPAGTYQLELYGRLGGQPNLPPTLLQSAQLQVSPAPVSVPSGGIWGLLALLASVALAARYRLTRGA